MASRKDYYDILGIRRGATPEEIEKAFQKLTRTYQFVPNPNNKTAESCFKEISEAYEILSNKEKREKYDRSGVELSFLDSAWDYDIEEEEEDSYFEGFEDVLGKYLGTVEAAVIQQPQKGRDIHCALEITFEEAIGGKITETQIGREIPCSSCWGTGVDPAGYRKICGQCGGAGQVQIGLPPSTFAEKCPRCHGRGKIPSQPCRTCCRKGKRIQKDQIRLQVPPGVNDGCRIFLKGMGQAGKNGGLNGDLIATIKVSRHPYFQRKGDDLHLMVPLTPWEAALGTEIEVPTLEGTARVTIPSGVQEGEELRLANRGIPLFCGGGRGDLVMAVKIVIPHNLSVRSKEILEELQRLNPGALGRNAIGVGTLREEAKKN
ncbi:MAG: DnaJ domain-containing protein [Deltaproteobacteria bacterium]|nr:DnaJ domain-containing protein [Deltaproteobacteria bacterium]